MKQRKAVIFYPAKKKRKECVAKLIREKKKSLAQRLYFSNRKRKKEYNPILSKEEKRKATRFHNALKRLFLKKFLGSPRCTRKRVVSPSWEKRGFCLLL